MTCTLLVGLLLGQTPVTEAPPSPDLQRIRKALDQPAPSLVSPLVRQDGTVFRVAVEGFDLAPAWEDRSIVPPYVRPWFRSYHHEHLAQVTPEEFRGATLHPYGLPIDLIVGALVKGIKDMRNASRQKRASEEVRKELEAFLACRADRSKPGCGGAD